MVLWFWPDSLAASDEQFDAEAEFEKELACLSCSTNVGFSDEEVDSTRSHTLQPKPLRALHALEAAVRQREHVAEALLEALKDAADVSTTVYGQVRPAGGPAEAAEALSAVTQLTSDVEPAAAVDANADGDGVVVLSQGVLTAAKQQAACTGSFDKLQQVAALASQAGCAEEADRALASFVSARAVAASQLATAAESGSHTAFAAARTAALRFADLQDSVIEHTCRFESRRHAAEAAVMAAAASSPLAQVEMAVDSALHLGVPSKQLAAALEAVRNRDIAATAHLSAVAAGLQQQVRTALRDVGHDHGITSSRDQGSSGPSDGLQEFDEAAAACLSFGLDNQVSAAKAKLNVIQEELRELDLSLEQLVDIDGLGQLCPQLQIVVINVNKLTQLAGLEGCAELRQLSAKVTTSLSLGRSCTNSTAVQLPRQVPDPASQPAMPSAGLSSFLVALTELKLSGNLLSDLSGLQGCSCLRVLDVSRNKLSCLQELSLSDNQVSRLDVLLHGCLQLRVVDLSFNRLQHLGACLECLASAPMLDQLQLHDNPWSSLGSAEDGLLAQPTPWDSRQHKGKEADASVQQNAATTIQAAIRGHVLRRRLKLALAAATQCRSDVSNNYSNHSPAAKLGAGDRSGNAKPGAGGPLLTDNDDDLAYADYPGIPDNFVCLAPELLESSLMQEWGFTDKATAEAYYRRQKHTQRAANRHRLQQLLKDPVVRLQRLQGQLGGTSGTCNDD
eukprot:gene9347-9510_t